MFNPKEIYTGWKNYIERPEVEEEETIRRAEICSTCSFAKKGLILTFVKDSLKNIEGRYCSSCEGCPLSAKIRSIGNCPENKW